MSAPYKGMSITDSRRQQANAQRKRMLLGNWDSDLIEYIGSYIDPARQAAWGRPVKSVNLMRSIVGQLSVLYDTAPSVTHPDTPDLAPLASLFHLHQRHEDFVIGIRESAIRLSWNEESHLDGGGLAVRLVTPENLVVESSPAAPGVPAVVYERTRRLNPATAKVETFWDVWDITDGDNPSFRIVSEGANPKDHTAVFAPDFVGNYPFRTATGTPFLPFVLYHARDTGQIWDSYDWDELPEATLSIALYYTFFNHAVKDASWVQKYGVNVDLQGGSTVGDGNQTRSRVSVDPATILLFRAKSGESGQLGSFPLPVNPEDLINAIRACQMMVCETLGIGKWDSQETSGQSGAALQIRKDQVRDMTARTEPQFRRGDTELLSKAAMIHNIFSGADPLPTDGYRIVYTSLPASLEEMTTEIDRDFKLIAAGLMSKVDMMMRLHPQMTRADALARLVEIQEERAALEGLTQGTPTGAS